MKYSKKYPKDYYWYSIKKSTFEARDNYFFMFICLNDDKIFIIPSKRIKAWLRNINDDKIKWFILIRERENMWFISTKKQFKPINITKYLNHFNQLKYKF
jgi:hypothetical protein